MMDVNKFVLLLFSPTQTVVESLRRLQTTKSGFNQKRNEEEMVPKEEEEEVFFVQGSKYKWEPLSIKSVRLTAP